MDQFCFFAFDSRIAFDRFINCLLIICRSFCHCSLYLLPHCLYSIDSVISKVNLFWMFRFSFFNFVFDCTRAKRTVRIPYLFCKPISRLRCLWLSYSRGFSHSTSSTSQMSSKLTTNSFLDFSSCSFTRR